MFAVYSEIQTASTAMEIQRLAGEVRSCSRCLHLSKSLYEANAPRTRIQVSDDGGATLHTPRRPGCDADRTVASPPTLFSLCWTTGENQRRRNVVPRLPSLRAC